VVSVVNINIPELRAAIEKAFPRVIVQENIYLSPNQKMVDDVLKAVLDVLEKPVVSGSAYEQLAQEG
jgi:hypothetical protein